MIEFQTIPGRLVRGHPLKPRAVTDRTTKQPKLNKVGQPRQAWTFGVAFPKAEFQASIWPLMLQEVGSVYPPTPHTNGMPSAPPKFAWKYIDGDGIDDEGKPYNLREGYAGCYILNFSTELKAPGLFKWNGASYDQLAPDAIKTGDYIVVGATMKANVPQDKTETPGLYMNPEGVQFIAYGPEIISQGTVDPMTMFKGQTYALPPGASATPIGGGAGVGMPGMGMQQPGMMAPAMQPGMTAPAMQPGMTAPQPMAAPMAAPAPAMAAPAPVGPQRPLDPSHIAPNPGTGQEMWWINGAWTPAPAMPAPAHDFVANAGMPMMAPAPVYQPQPGMMAPR